MINIVQLNLLNTHNEDVIWNNRKPITTDYYRSSMYFYGGTGPDNIFMQAGIRTIILVRITSLDIYVFLMDIYGLRINQNKLEDLSIISVDKVYYIPFKGNKINEDLDNIGYYNVPVSPLNEEPRYALTEAFSGCAFIVTKEPSGNTFRVWHFQSPDFNPKQTERFVRKHCLDIYDYVCYRDYGAPVGSTEHYHGNATANIYLFYDRNNRIWSIKCIPAKKIIYFDGIFMEWGGDVYETSTYKNKFAREIDFSKPLYNPSEDKEKFIKNMVDRLT